MSTEQTANTTLDTVVLRRGPLEATFLPAQGMNLTSFRHHDLRNHRPEQHRLRPSHRSSLRGPQGQRSFRMCQIWRVFPILRKMKERKVIDPFHSGVGRYAPWQVLKSTERTISAAITGKQDWNGTTLGVIENQNFRMTCDADLSDHGLRLTLTVVSDSDSVVGFAHRYRTSTGQKHPRGRRRR